MIMRDSLKKTVEVLPTSTEHSYRAQGCIMRRCFRYAHGYG